MDRDPFENALAMCSESEAESNTTLTLGGVQPSPTAVDTDVIDVDRDQDGVQPTPKAKGKKKRKLSDTKEGDEQCSKATKVERAAINTTKIPKTIPLEYETNEADLKTVFLVGAGGSKDVIPLHPQYKVHWRDVQDNRTDFRDAQWIIIGTQELWIQLILKHCMKLVSTWQPGSGKKTKTKEIVSVKRQLVQDLVNYIKSHV